MHITKHIRKVIKNDPTLFTTSGGMTDFSEYQGLDNLQNPTGPILKSLQKIAKIYGTKSSFYLINGSSSGIIALMLATVKKGEKVLIARNAHKSVINALILSGAEPLWVETEWNEDWNIPSSVNPQKIAQKLNDYPDIKAVWITSPTYEGIASDIKAIADLCREKKVLLIVDEAHGALWSFSELLPNSAIHCGADACVQSLHKTASCLNQGALLHLAIDSNINSESVQQSLNIINTTSPSYILLSSIEASINYLNSIKGRKKIENLLNNINSIKNHLKKNSDVTFLENSDPTKMFFGIPGVSGDDLSDFLEDEFNIEVELNNDVGLLAITGIGTTKRNFKKLTKGLEKASKKLQIIDLKTSITPYIEPIISLTPSQAFNMESTVVDKTTAVGLTSKETIVNYPPGIPIIIAGEVIQKAHIDILKEKESFIVVKKEA